MSSKVKRKVTVENSNNESDSSRRPSVFERLGPGAVTLNAQTQDRHSRNAEPGEKCRNWLRTGSCSYGSSCRYQHESYSSSSGRQRKTEREIDEKDLRYKVRSKRKDTKEPRTNTSPSPKKANRKHAENRTSRKSDHESKLGLKSTVVITRPRSPVSEGEEAPQRDPGWEDDSDDWPMDASQLDYKEELTLEMKRQQLQKELEIELQKERMMNENVTITKPVSTASSSSSSSRSSSSSSSSSSSESRSASSTSESSSSGESEGERSSSSCSSSSSASFRKKGGAKALAQRTSKSPKKQAKEIKHSRSSGQLRHDKNKDKAKQSQSVRNRDNIRPPPPASAASHESRSRRRRNKGAESKSSAKGERFVDDRSSGHMQRGPRTPSPAGPSHGKQWQGASAGPDHQDDKRGKNKRHKRRGRQATKEPAISPKTHSSATLQHSGSPNRHSGGARRHRHRDDSSVERQKSVPKNRVSPPGRRHYSRSPLPPLSLPPKVAADTREHEKAERRAAHFNDSSSQSSTAARASKKSRKGQRASSKVLPVKPESGSSHRPRDMSRDKLVGEHTHGNDRRGVGVANDRGAPYPQQGVSGRDRRRESPPSRDKEHRLESGNKRLPNTARNANVPEEPRWSGERGGRRVERGRKEDEKMVQRTDKSSSAVSVQQTREQSGKRKLNSSPGWDKEQRPYEVTEPLNRYGDPKIPGRSNDDRRPERGRDKIQKHDPDKDLEPPNKRRATSTERQRMASHPGRDNVRQTNSPPRSGRAALEADKSTDREYSKNYKNDPRREDPGRVGDQRGFVEGLRHRDQDYPLERPPIGEYGPDPYRDYRYPDTERDHYAARRDYPHRRGELDHEGYGPPYMREEYLYPPPLPALPPEDWDHYREYSANHEPLGPMMMVPPFRGRGDSERAASDRYRELDARNDSRIPPREDNTRPVRDRRPRVRSPDWPSRRDERREPSPVPPPRSHPQVQESANWERESRHSSRGSAEGLKSSQKKEDIKPPKRDTSAPSSSSSGSSKREKEKSSSKKEPKEKGKPQQQQHREKDKHSSEKSAVETTKKKRSRSKSPLVRPPSASLRSESKKEAKKKSSSSGEKAERRKTSGEEKRKKASLPSALSLPIQEKECIIKEEGEIKLEPPPPALLDEPQTPPHPIPAAAASPVRAQSPCIPTSPAKDVIVEKEVAPLESDLESKDEIILEICEKEEVENFSDWSDDDDDELLTRIEPVEDKSKGAEKDEKGKTVPATVKTEPQPVVQETRRERSSRRRSRSHSRDRRSKEKPRDDRQEKKETLPRIDESAATPTSRTESLDPKEEDIDYDPISDDELEAMIEEPDELGKEEEAKSGFIDSLGVDWASLASDTLPRPSFKPGNARKRFSTVRVLQRVGISQAWAGAELTQKVIKLCEEQLQKESAEDKSTGPEPVPKKRFVLEHPIAAFQVAAIEQRKARASILHNMGPYRRALCARQDLLIRRQLCKVGIKGADSLSYNQQQQHVDKELYKLSVEIFRRNRSNQNTVSCAACCS